ncbi:MULTISPECIES: hypothetical protein [Mesoflavibacter]|uniref:SH3b domain-containing protein n=1 Tax=Mesoflavibacter profundi TaxID=2708110 RepID=A0ABT4S3C2_9FLAO|nr:MULTISPECIES: hypothetical protein [Mesoflavibacter]MDA0178531.1 hypothetical protein [Mesoflavibacter profundi]QIJ89470.1 hypothetical protein C7H62_1661 [Mesoflavibacter sp. HG96]QIJ92198.1 hypothetical protein C7H56_1661 [Mesoflavibacter sp. HG37]
MKILKIVTIITVLFTTVLSAQEQLNNYKYVIVKEQYDFQKEPNQYRLNGLTKFLLEKQNFKVLMENETLPEDAVKDNCLVLRTSVIDESGMFKTKLKFQFKDCYGKEVYTTDIGESREKKYIVAFNEAVRNALNSLSNFTHKYEAKENNEAEVVVTTVPKVKQEPIKDTVDKSDAEDTKTKSPVNNTKNNIENNTLIAEAFGVINYNLKNSNGQTVYTILYSGKEDLYIVKGKDAVLYKINNNWVIATQVNGKLELEPIAIKF